ncbi:hypothetical protein Poli38472_012620 [Pythium oligandrum]|uniref:Protein-L-isoaspartate O-methyltransferase n=1 Tax=Pythium oligandrum TaxID=41045 RepID=A0A8K1CE84_PYTOL|nr:hypothetical protein Poli38472_012620 [Pythium oligandrum]|eukprot:TMW61429.1 hypothetical protein Poli38472_012620 [Pythium oligandrum]
MAWRCSALSNEGLVDNLARAGIVQSRRVIHAMKATDRAKYMATATGINVEARVAYMDAPQHIGHRQTISAPHMHAYALELAEAAVGTVDQPRVLDVGAGSGYLSACLGRMVEDRGGHVFGIERIPELVAFAAKNIGSADPDLIERGVVSIEQADGWSGLSSAAPFHFIHVGAAAVEPPQALMDQLANGGRLLVPVGPEGEAQVLLEIQRTDQTFTQRKLMGVSYVPLVREQRTEL